MLVSATDAGGLQGFCNISVTVRDVNRAPRFIGQPFAVHVAEGAPVGQVVARMRAEDEDRGENARLRFSLLVSGQVDGGGEEKEKFFGCVTFFKLIIDFFTIFANFYFL